MNIPIAVRLKPFSHMSGSKCLLPGTTELVEAFPHHLKVGSVCIPLESDPLTHPFTLQQDLEKNCVWVFGKSYRYKIQACPEGFEVKGQKQTSFFKLPLPFYASKEIERLSLGSHKAQDWDLVMRRMDLKEILPFLFSLSQKVPHSDLGTSNLLTLQAIESFYRINFEGILVPKDTDRQKLLSTAYHSIRALFFVETEKNLILKDCLFPEGRMINIQTKMGILSFEWSRYRVRRAIFKADETGQIDWLFPQKIRCFRSKTFPNQKGCMNLVENPFLVEKGHTYFLDRFFE